MRNAESRERIQYIAAMNAPALPSTPYFVVWRKWYAIEFRTEVETRAQVSHLALAKQTDLEGVAYDAASIAWHFRYARPANSHSLLFKVLAHTIHNPVRQVAVTWAPRGPYDLDELRDAYLHALSRDDDVLTQFVSGDELEVRIRSASTFQELVEVWKWMTTDHDAIPLERSSESD